MDKKQSKVIVKDVKHLLSKGKRIQLVSKNVISMPIRGLRAMKNWFGKRKDDLKRFVSEKKEQLEIFVSDEINAKRRNKVDPIVSELDEMTGVYNKYKNPDEYNIEVGSKEDVYLTALHDRIKKFREKKTNAEGKNYGVFWMSRKALKKFAKSKINKEDTKRTSKPKKKKAKDNKPKTDSISDVLKDLSKTVSQLSSEMQLLRAQMQSLDSENSRLRSEIEQLRMSMGMNNSSTMHK